MAYPFDHHLPSPIDRFTARLFRREFFESLAATTMPNDVPWKPLLFGSSVVQLYRPLPQGYPISRMAGDVDLGIVYPKSSTPGGDPETRTREQVGKIILENAKAIGAEVKEIKGNFPGYDGVRIEKTFQPEDIESAIKDRHEARHFDNIDPVRSSIAIEPVVIRSPFMPVIEYGSICHEDLREVTAIKMARLLVPKKFQMRDIVDIYNVTNTKPKIAAIGVGESEQNELMRLIVLGTLARWGNIGQLSLTKLEQDHINVTELAERMGVDIAVAIDVLVKVEQTVEAIFPNLGTRRGEFDQLLRPNEEAFLSIIQGIEILPGPVSGRRITQPKINTTHLETERNKDLRNKFPGLLANIARHHEVEQRIRDVVAERNTIDY